MLFEATESYSVKRRGSIKEKQNENRKVKQEREIKKMTTTQSNKKWFNTSQLSSFFNFLFQFEILKCKMEN